MLIISVLGKLTTYSSVNYKLKFWWLLITLLSPKFEGKSPKFDHNSLIICHQILPLNIYGDNLLPLSYQIKSLVGFLSPKQLPKHLPDKFW